MVERTIDPKAAGRESGGQPIDVREARWMLVGIAAWAACCDLIVKVVEPTESGLYHRRGQLELLLILTITATAVYFIPLARSRLIAVGAGLMVGGGIGNGLSIILFPLGVPNPFTVSQHGWTIAFNLADVCVAIGFLLMVSGVAILSISRRHELHETIEH